MAIQGQYINIFKVIKMAIQGQYINIFKVIYFSIIEEPLRSYIAQYNKSGTKCEGSEDIASE